MTGGSTSPPPSDDREAFSLEAMAPLLGELSVDDVHRCHRLDQETARAVRLDPHSALRAATEAARAPDTRPPLGPGAIPGLRAAIHGLCPEIPTDTTALEPSQVAGAAARYAYARAVPFLLAAEHSAMLCDSEPPAAGFFDHAHLPYEAVSLWFARPVELLLTSTDFEITHLLSVAVAGRPGSAGLVGPAVWHFLTDDDRIVVQADPSWTGHGWPSDILANALAAVVAFPFRPPPPTPPELDATNAASRRAALRSTRVRRAIERGALTGVHVLDVPRLAPQSRVDPALVADYLASRRSVRPHWRRGHWKRYRIARRSPTGEVIGDIHGESGVDWDYRLRWIAPIRVNATGDQSDTGPLVSVYRLRAPGGPPRSS
jgi:hypothetical protein